MGAQVDMSNMDGDLGPCPAPGWTWRRGPSGFPAVDAPSLKEGEPMWALEKKLGKMGWSLAFEARAEDGQSSRQLWSHPSGVLATAKFVRGSLRWQEEDRVTHFSQELGLASFDFALQTDLGAAAVFSDWESRTWSQKMGGECFWSPEGTRRCSWRGGIVHSSHWGAALGRMMSQGKLLGFDDWTEGAAPILSTSPWLWSESGHGPEDKARDEALKQAWMKSAPPELARLWGRAPNPDEMFDRAMRSGMRSMAAAWMCEQTALSAGAEEGPAWPSEQAAKIYRQWTGWLDGQGAEPSAALDQGDGAGGNLLHVLACAQGQPGSFALLERVLAMEPSALRRMCAQVDAAGFTPLGRCFDAVGRMMPMESAIPFKLISTLSDALGPGLPAACPGGATEWLLTLVEARERHARPAGVETARGLLQSCESCGVAVEVGPEGVGALAARLRGHGLDRAGAWLERVALESSACGAPSRERRPGL